VARCPAELLDDLAKVFAEIRRWAGVVEKTPGVFYVRRTPFLHFHRTADGRRRADIKTAGDRWVAFDLPRPIAAAHARAFLRELNQQYGDRERGLLSTRAARTRSGRTAASRPDSGRGGSPRRGS
jgi:hypothetical protein